jgi:drug/metabolite transporter (DMT)-like permease
MIFADAIFMKKGIALALCTALISGISVFINGAAVSQVDPSLYTALKGIITLIFLVASALALRDIKAFRLSPKQWLTLALIGVIGGSIPFLMFFWGLRLGGAAVSSFIYRSLFIFAGVFGYLLLRERPEPRDIAAGVLILAGNALLLSGSIGFGLGQMLVLGATILWALEYTISRKVMADVEPHVVMIGRMLFGSLVLLGFFALDGSLPGLVASVASTASPWLIVTSLLLFAFLATWYNALKELPVLKATSIFALGGVVTALLNLIIGKAPSFVEAFGLLLILAGALAAAGIVSAILRSLKFRRLAPDMME